MWPTTSTMLPGKAGQAGGGPSKQQAPAHHFWRHTERGDERRVVGQAQVAPEPHYDAAEAALRQLDFLDGRAGPARGRWPVALHAGGPGRGGHASWRASSVLGDACASRAAMRGCPGAGSGLLATGRNAVCVCKGAGCCKRISTQCRGVAASQEGQNGPAVFCMTHARLAGPLAPSGHAGQLPEHCRLICHRQIGLGECRAVDRQAASSGSSSSAAAW